MEARNEIKVLELNMVMCETEYEEKLKQRWERLRGEVVGGWRGSGVDKGRQFWRH